MAKPAGDSDGDGAADVPPGADDADVAAEARLASLALPLAQQRALSH